MKFFKRYLQEMARKMQDVDAKALAAATDMVLSANAKGGKTIVVGNGGSAATASHVSVDLTKNSGVRAINFNEADLLTCFANDYGYEHWVEKAIEFYAEPNDVVILISSSGKSANIVNGAKKARQFGLPVITLSGFKPDNPLRKIGNVNLWVDSDSYNVVEITHLVWLVAVVDKIAEKTPRQGKGQGR
jgi:D-sedoheptulose 7-phosphate isomerase